MGRASRVDLGRGGIIAVASTGLAYALLASLTRPFTVGADVVTAIPLTVAAFGTAWWIWNRRRPHTAPSVPGAADGARWSRSWIVWIGSIGVAAAWELYCYANLPRVQHPTVSALIDILDSSRLGKTVGFASWLALGWFLVVR